ncbi:PREDICTED: glutamate receptor 2.3-like [Erythranthe guttata]|uniref:glutamate receptor 2.3-like n=1 Tax=Erythranthe guttata TaxID=4155 RepID=UPI00064DF73B|nr:PREDICTED: glutamate receptor 2.3-like [Erythranthe guttata]|eukprot:XP_012855810.1 PREDICTED: glutamate receptor 2.3-like [Erythranthe guttata]
MAAAQNISVRVGVVLDMDEYGKMAFNCISMALSDFYTTHDSYNTRLFLYNRDSNGDVIGAAAAGLDLLKNIEVQAIIGPMYSVQANFLISLGQKAHVPIITFSATSPSLSSLRSPYFVRATLNDSTQVNPIVAIIQAFKWKEVVPIYEDNEFGEGIVPFLSDALEQVNVRVPYRSVIPSLATDEQIVDELNKLKTMQTRVFIVHMLRSLGSRLFAKAAQLGMMSKDYAWIITDSITNELTAMDPSLVASMLGVIGVKPYIPQTKELDDFAIRYKNKIQQSNPKALNLDIYGIWAYDSALALAMAVEKAELANLTYQKTNTSTNSTDLEAFGVSLSGPKLIQALLSITFRGLAGNFQLVDGQLQAPPYEIVNIVGPGASGIGYWTKENGIVNKLNFSSSSASAYSTSKDNLGSITWPGNESSPPKGWVVPTKTKKMRVGVPVKDGFTEFVRVTWNSDNSTTVEGFCIDIFDAVMKALPYDVPYEYIPFATPDHKMAGDYNEMAYQVYLGNYDAVAGDVTILGNRSQYVDFTLPFIESGVSMVVPIPEDKKGNTWILVKPLTWELWSTIFFFFVIIGILVWLLERPENRDFRGSRWDQFCMIFWFSFSTMFFAHKEKVKTNSAKIVVIAWLLAVFILTQGYASSLTSMLTAQQLIVNDVNELIRNKDYVGYSNTSFVYGFLKNLFNESQLRPFNSAEEMDELLSKGSANGGIAAAFHEIPYIKMFLGKYCSKYMMVGPTYKAAGFGFVFPIDSPLVPDVSREILNVTEVQKMVDIEKKWLGDESKCPDTDTKSIGLSSFRVVFIIVGTVGIAVVINYMIRQGRENKNVHKDDPPIVHNDPPIVHNDPPIVHNDPPIIHNDPPIIHNDPPIVHNDPQLSIMIPQLSIMIPQLSIMIPKLSIMIPQLRDRYMSYGSH